MTISAVVQLFSGSLVLATAALCIRIVGTMAVIQFVRKDWPDLPSEREAYSRVARAIDFRTLSSCSSQPRTRSHLELWKQKRSASG